jgi:hypothetical protein
MVRNLGHDEDDPGAPRRRLDSTLDVAHWSVPGRGPTARQRLRRENPGAPDWWYGDEDASQSFLTEMGAG